ncbi:hypothetical protein J6590_067495, partial [Homalodisca vitripennis]
RNMGSYGREKFPHLLEKSPHVREKFPAHTLILSKCSKFWVFSSPYHAQLYTSTHHITQKGTIVFISLVYSILTP